MAERKNHAKWIESRQRWQINVQKDGIRKTFVDYNPKPAGQIAAEKKADKWLEGETVTKDAKISKLLEEYLAYLKENKSAGHYTQYEGFVRLYIQPVIGLKKATTLTEGDLQEVLDRAHKKKELAQKTLTDVRGCMMNWLKWCRARKKITLHPEGLTIPASAKRSEKKIVEPDGLKVLFSKDEAPYHRAVKPDFFIHAYRFAVLTGLRPGELVGLERQDRVSATKIKIRRAVNVRGEVTEGKNKNAWRVFVLSAQAAAELDAQLEMLKKAGMITPYLFPDRRGERLRQGTLYQAWTRYCEYQEIPHVSLYELRHTYVSITDEMPDALKKMVVGHSKNMDTEGVYGHQKAGDLEKAAKYSEAAFLKVLNG